MEALPVAVRYCKSAFVIQYFCLFWGKQWKRGFTKCLGMCTAALDVWMHANATYNGGINPAVYTFPLHQVHACMSCGEVCYA